MAKTKTPTKVSDLIPDFNTKSLAPYIGYSRFHIYNLIRKNAIPFNRNGFYGISFSKSEIDKWVESNPKKRVNKKETVCCDTCKNDFQLHNYRVGKSQKNYCSRECRKTARLINCDWCSKEILRVPAQIEKHNFCSKGCMGKYQTKNYAGENSKHFLGDYKKYYGASWLHQRNAARERDNFECQLCSKKEDKKQHDVHHKKAFALFGVERHIDANDLSNLITLCNACHSSIEPKRRRSASLPIPTLP